MSFAILLASAGCDAAGDVRVQPLPPLTRPSPEARVGLPELQGAWRFAGWELAPADSANLHAVLPGFGQLLVQSQRLDSVAGFYVSGGARLPLVGEVRRDSIVALVAYAAPGDARYLAGSVAGDTIWLWLTSLVEGGEWPTGGRAAFVRGDVAATFVRLEGARSGRPVADTLPPLPADSAPSASLPTSPPTARPPTPTGPPPDATPRPLPPPTREPAPAPTPEPPLPEPEIREPEPEIREPEPEIREPEIPPPPPPIRLLGEPVRPDPAPR